MFDELYISELNKFHNSNHFDRVRSVSGIPFNIYYNQIFKSDIDWDDYNDGNYLWYPGIWYIMTERGLEKKYKDQQEDVEPYKRKKKRNKQKGDGDPLELRIEKELEEHTDISKRKVESIDQDIESVNTNSNAYQAGRILFSALSLLRVGR